MLWLWIAGCTPPLESEDVRDQLDSPTGTLSAATLPHVVDDWFQVDTSYGAVTGAFSLIDLVRGSPARRAPAPDLGPDGPQKGLIGGAICAARFINELAQWDNCDSGTTCEASITLHSCMLNDPQSRGKLRFGISASGTDEAGEAAMEIEFHHFRTTDFGTITTELDGVVEMEVSTPLGEMGVQTVYVVDLNTKTIDMAERGMFGGGVLEEIDLRVGMRVSAENSEEAQVVTMEFLAWIDEDGDGRDDGSVVVGMDIGNLENGDLTTGSVFVRDSRGQWTCSFTLAVRETLEGSSRWVSEGTCTDPNGDQVDFAGFVEE